MKYIRLSDYGYAILEKLDKEKVMGAGGLIVSLMNTFHIDYAEARQIVHRNIALLLREKLIEEVDYAFNNIKYRLSDRGVNVYLDKAFDED